jgi:hypothetical protein
MLSTNILDELIRISIDYIKKKKYFIVNLY